MVGFLNCFINIVCWTWYYVGVPRLVQNETMHATSPEFREHHFERALRCLVRNPITVTLHVRKARHVGAIVGYPRVVLTLRHCIAWRSCLEMILPLSVVLALTSELPPAVFSLSWDPTMEQREQSFLCLSGILTFWIHKDNKMVLLHSVLWQFVTNNHQLEEAFLVTDISTF